MSHLNLWPRYKVKCPNDFSFSQLNMKRKAVTLQYRQNAFALSKKEKFNLIVQGRYYNNKTPASDLSASDPSSCKRISSSPASTNDVPGDKSFMIKNDINVPIYNYIPVKRTYKGGANKYPYSAWSYGKTGFPVGSKGSSAESRAAAVNELSNNAPLYSKLALTSCDYIPCRGKTLMVTFPSTSIYLQSYIDSSNNRLITSETLKLKLTWLNIPDYSALYNKGGAWAGHNKNNSVIHLVTVYNNIFTYYFIKNDKLSKSINLTNISVLKPFMVLQNSTKIPITDNLKVPLGPTLQTDCSEVLFNYNATDINIPLRPSTPNSPSWIKPVPTLCNNTSILCYWWSQNDNLYSSPHPATPPKLYFGISGQNNLKYITNKDNYQITITCDN
jgi:hypothetical protein